MDQPALSADEQELLIAEIMTNPAAVPDGRLEEVYNLLDNEHKAELNEQIGEYADNAVGSEHWDSDN